MLDYTIEFLASNGVGEIFVLCKAHAEALQAHIGTLKDKIGLKVKCIVAPNSKNIGDALRAVAEQDLLTQDFVLVYGDIVSNQKLIPIIQEHILRREKDKNVLMTLLLTKAVEDQELAKLKIPLLNTLFSSSSQAPAASAALGNSMHTAMSASASGLGSQHITPHASALIAPDDDGFYDPLGSSSTSSSSRAASHVVTTNPTGHGSKSVGGGASSVSASTASLPAGNALGESSAMQEKTSTSAAAAPRLGESSVYLTLSSNESKLVIMDYDSGQIFLYEDRSSTHQTPHVELDTALLKEHDNILVRNDLQDSGVAVCSPDVLLKFSDHFDFKNVSQLVRGVINDELQELKVFAAIGDSNYYTNRVSSLRRYHQVTMDVLRRWAFPLVPDANIMPGSSWSYARPGIYKEQGVHLHRDCKVLSNSAIGTNSSLSAGTVVAHSTIGRRCNIGKNVKISHSFLWDDVTIEDDVTLDHVIVCSGATILKGASVAQGSIVGYNVRVGSGVALPPLTKLTAFGLASSGSGTTAAPQAKHESDFDEDFEDNYSADSEDEDEKKASSVSVTANIADVDLGLGGVGRKWNLPPLPFNELYAGWETVNHIRDVLASMHRARNGGIIEDKKGGANAATGDANAEDQLTDLEAFSREVESVVVNYCTDLNRDPEQVILEINSLKYAHDRSYLECLTAFFSTLLSQVESATFLKSFKALLTRFRKFFPKFASTDSDYKELLFSIEELCEPDALLTKQFTNILNLLYELEIVPQAAFLEWAAEHDADAEDDDAEENASVLYKSAKKFIDWLKEEEEEDDEDEDEDE